MTKQFKVAGVSKGEDGYKVRFATDMTRVKILAKYFTDVQLIELPEPMDKPAVVTFLKASELYANPVYKEVIDNADAKYNAVATVKVAKTTRAPKVPKEKAEMSLDAIKARKPKATAASKMTAQQAEDLVGEATF